MRDYVDNLMNQQSTLIVVDLKIQQQQKQIIRGRHKTCMWTQRLLQNRYEEESFEKIFDDIVTHSVQASPK